MISFYSIYLEIRLQTVLAVYTFFNLNLVIQARIRYVKYQYKTKKTFKSSYNAH
jgi:hypothetical protein